MGEPALHQYDDDSSEQPVTRPNLHAISGGGETTDRKTGHLHSVEGGGDDAAAAESSGRHLRAVPDPAEESEAQKLGAITGQAPEDGDGFYRDEGGRQKVKNRNNRSKGLSRGGLLKVGAAGGVIGLIMTLASFGSFLNVFKLDHVMKNVDKKAFSRLQASTDARNHRLLQAYIQVRSTEIEGDAKHDTLYFRSKKVEAGSPFADWYHTMRTNGFEEKLLNEQGIAFVSMVDENGHIKPAKITGKDAIPRDLAAKLDGINNENFVDRLNGLQPEEIEKAFSRDKFDTNKAARKSVKSVVNDNIPWFRVIKRRHIRKDIANKTGIKNWRLFEKTRDKIDQKKIDIKNNLFNKMIDKFYSNNPSTNHMLKCLFSDGSCGSSSDPESTEDKIDGKPGGEEINSSDETNADKTKDKNGNVIKTDLADGEKALADETKTAIADAGKTGVDKETTKGLSDLGAKRLEKASFGKKIIYSLIAKITGKGIDEVLNDSIPIPNPLTIWTWAKRIAKIDSLFYADKAANSQISKMVENAKRAQLAGVFATYAMANDQIKSGQLVGDELNNFFTTTNNMGNSEGWLALNNELGGSGKVSAQSTKDSPDKNTYCNPDYVPKPNDFAYYCDSQKPNYGGNAQKISDVYQSTIGGLIHPLAHAIQQAEESVVGKVADFVGNITSAVVGKVTDPLVNSFLKNTDLGKSLTELISGIMEKLLAFLGAGPMFDPGQPGNIGNLLVAGGTAQAEDSTRASGGFKSTQASAAFSDKLALNYEAEQRKNESFKDRYLSLDSPDSVASTTLFAVANTSAANIATKFSTAFGSLPQMIGSLFSGRALAQTQQTDLDQWAGVDRYDIPQQCIEFDPLDTNPMHGTNYYSVTHETTALDWDTLKDNDKFYKKAYEWAGKDQEKIDMIPTIWNCRILDTRAMGGMGYQFGFTKDAGYDPGGSSSGTTTSVGGSANCQNAQGADKIPCEGAKYIGLPYGHRGVHSDGGAEGYRQRCPDANIPSDTSCAIDCSGFVSVMLYDAFGQAEGFPKNISLYVSTSDGTLINQTAGQGPSPLFKEIPITSIMPGDILTMPDHTAVVEGYDPATGKLKTIESVGGGNRLGPNHWEWKQIGEEGFNRAFRYIGPGAPSQ